MNANSAFHYYCNVNLPPFSIRSMYTGTWAFRFVSSVIFPVTPGKSFVCASAFRTAALSVDFARLNAPDHRGVRHLLFFRVEEPKTTKNRMHVDLASRDADAEITRLVALGGSLVDGTPPQWRTGNGTRWVVMQDPEGNEFCLG